MNIFSLDNEPLNNFSEDKVYIAKRTTSNENDIGNFTTTTTNKKPYTSK